MVINYIKIVGHLYFYQNGSIFYPLNLNIKVKSIMFTQFKRLLIGKPKRNRDLKMKESVISRL